MTNRAVELWQRYENRPKYDGPDGLTIDGEKIQFGGKEPMAIVVELSQDYFDGVIRMVRRADISRVEAVYTAVAAAMKRVRAKSDPSLAVTVTPTGLVAQNVGTIVAWTKRVGRRNRVAVRQLRVLEATAAARMK